MKTGRRDISLVPIPARPTPKRPAAIGKQQNHVSENPIAGSKAPTPSPKNFPRSLSAMILVQSLMDCPADQFL